jgi:DNA (cytosine-5)-methyltransferase 1
LIDENNVPDEYFIPSSELPKWQFHKGAKSLERVKKDGTVYSYDEGPVSFPDSLDKPSRTIITGEGGRSPSRFKHVVLTESGKYRRLTPVELERLNGFPDNHTLIDSVTDARRAFFMGNALVTGVVTRIAMVLVENKFI